MEPLSDLSDYDLKMLASAVRLERRRRKGQDFGPCRAVVPEKWYAKEHACPRRAVGDHGYCRQHAKGYT